MHDLCRKKLNIVIQHPKVRSRKHTINECLKIFHKAKNVDKVKNWKTLHATMKNMKMITMGFTTLFHYVKKIKMMTLLNLLRLNQMNVLF